MDSIIRSNIIIEGYTGFLGGRLLHHLAKRCVQSLIALKRGPNDGFKFIQIPPSSNETDLHTKLNIFPHSRRSILFLLGGPTKHQFSNGNFDTIFKKYRVYLENILKSIGHSTEEVVIINFSTEHVNQYIADSSLMSSDLLLYAKFHLEREALLQQFPVLTKSVRLPNIYGYPIQRNPSFDRLLVPYTAFCIKTGVHLKLKSPPKTKFTVSDVNDFLSVCEDLLGTAFEKDVGNTFKLRRSSLTLLEMRENIQSIWERKSSRINGGIIELAGPVGQSKLNGNEIDRLLDLY